MHKAAAYKALARELERWRLLPKQELVTNVGKPASVHSVNINGENIAVEVAAIELDGLYRTQHLRMRSWRSLQPLAWTLADRRSSSDNGDCNMLANSPGVIDALVESLRHDPFYLAITEGYGVDETQRSQALSRYFDYSMSEGARVGRCVQSDDDAPAAAVWLLPLTPERAAAEKSAKAAFLKRALEPKGAENYHRIVEFMASRSRSIVSSAAWYLSIVGVAPRAQGQGVGGRLIRATLAEADQVGAPSFLETFSQRNVALYERLDFSVVASYEEPITQSQYWIMQRAPNTSLERTR